MDRQSQANRHCLEEAVAEFLKNKGSLRDKESPLIERDVKETGKGGLMGEEDIRTVT